MTLRSLALAGVMVLACALPAAAQSSSTFPVKDSTSTTRNFAGQADAAGAFHYRDIMEGLTAAGAPDAFLSDGAGHQLVTLFGTPSVSISNTPTVNIGSTGGGATASAQGTGNASLASIAAYTKPVTSFAPITVGTAFTPGLGIAAVCTAAGNVVLAGSDASQITVPVGVGFNQFGFAVAKVVSQTATCTFTALS